LKASIEELKQVLSSKNISLSHQRLKVLEFLAENQIHPTADQIFTALQKSIPTLSKTTVYNTLRILADAGLVRVIAIEDNETRYDIEMQSHGHFKCEACGAIYNFNIDVDAMAPEDLNGFKIQNKDVYFKGICPKCLSIKNNSI